MNAIPRVIKQDPAILTSGAVLATGPDAELIAACLAFGRQNALRHEIDAPDSIITDEEVDEQASAWIIAKDRVESLPATTLEGRTMKAAVAFAALRFRANYDPTQTWQEQADSTTRLVLTCLLDAVTPDPHSAVWRAHFPLFEGELPDAGAAVRQALADCQTLALVRGWQGMDMAWLQDGFETNPDTMGETLAGLTEAAARYQKLGNLLRGEAIRYGMAKAAACGPGDAA